jgi:O-methyltransferase involved in polyketide biosynthesis
MMGNERLGLTAEMAALIRAEKSADKCSKYFVTPRARRIYSIIKFVFPRKTIEKIFDKRTSLSKQIHQFVESCRPEQIVELAAGSSAFGLEYSQKYSNKVYVETDLPEIIRKKADILKIILREESLTKSPNHILLPLDVLKDDIHKILKNRVKKSRKIVVFAEGLTSYFDSDSYETYLANVAGFLDKIADGVYVSHETLGESMTSGFGGKILRGLVSLITRSKAHKHFASAEELREYYKKKGFKEVKHSETDSGSYIFSMKRITKRK